MSRLVRKSQNVSVLLYHYVCPAKYRRVVFDKKVDGILKEICIEIAKRYEIEFIQQEYPVACHAVSTLE
ncbi:MAG: transposase [Anaerolineales bacterium]|nr:transposase [Anaerolineales bacterium]